ncbi:hypothetical protein N7462_008266 [Penicillium macrosclerotiorum]|uniref:uncharacterized protein n=1 Tax=Penicillium macrosclerotiorum TaxID=303699 RepID=UPI002547D603|nr:uncharacterized protein N7462_008266 [Penicillium macrosclerotiorum]KAJ5675369.1 hypothetical protein N7462_008266 [Penicillium macrosclerotiorum]
MFSLPLSVQRAMQQVQGEIQLDSSVGDSAISDRHNSPASPLVTASLQLPRRRSTPARPNSLTRHINSLKSLPHSMASPNALDSPDSYAIAGMTALHIE